MAIDWSSTLARLVGDERLHVAAIGIAAVGIVSTMVTVLGRVRDGNQIAPEEPRTQYITQETEDALPNHTLATLVQHPNSAIRDVASRIVCDRAMNDKESLMVLLCALAQDDYECRLKSIKTLTLLMVSWSGQDCLQRLHDLNAYFYLVQCLKRCLGDRPIPDLSDAYWDEYNFRDKAEKLCLTLALRLCNRHGARGLARAGFVEKWLAKQDWGWHDDIRHLRFAMYLTRKQNRIVELCYRLRQSKTGVRALREARLLEKPYLPSNSTSPRSRQLREGSEEQRRLRRQHREAMVLNDGTRPLGQADIIERDHD